MARFFRLPVVPVGFDGFDDHILNTDYVKDIRRAGFSVFITMENGIAFLLNFKNEDQAVDFINKNFLIFNA